MSLIVFLFVFRLMLSGDDRLVASLMKELKENGSYQIYADLKERIQGIYSYPLSEDKSSKISATTTLTLVTAVSVLV